MSEARPTPATKRRWFRFSLRTLMVVMGLVALPFGWFGYNLNWIRQRHNALSAANPTVFSVGIPKQAPGMLGLLGETGYQWLDVIFPPRPDGKLTHEELEDIERLRTLFPEAKYIHWNSTGQMHNGYPTFGN